MQNNLLFGYLLNPFVLFGKGESFEERWQGYGRQSSRRLEGFLSFEKK
jgi:hypothetical protein